MSGCGKHRPGTRKGPRWGSPRRSHRRSGRKTRVVSAGAKKRRYFKRGWVILGRPIGLRAQGWGQPDMAARKGHQMLRQAPLEWAEKWRQVLHWDFSWILQPRRALSQASEKGNVFRNHSETPVDRSDWASCTLRSRPGDRVVTCLIFNLIPFTEENCEPKSSALYH